MPLHFRLEDLPTRFHRQVEEQLAPRLKTTPPQKTSKNAPTTHSKPNPSPRTSKLVERDYSPSKVAKPPIRESNGEPNRTEAEFNAKFLDGKGRYEAISFRLPGGSLYTPDWFYFDNGIPTFVECKGSYHFASHGRSVTAFKESAALFPFWNFVWAAKQKGGKWSIKRLERSFDLSPSDITPIINNIDSSLLISGKSVGVRERERTEKTTPTNATLTTNPPRQPPDALSD